MADDGYLLAGDELRARREKAGWSQRRVARMLGVTQSQVSDMETYARPTPERHRQRYAALFDDQGDRTAVRDAIFHLKRATSTLRTLNGYRDLTYMIEQTTKMLEKDVDGP